MVIRMLLTALLVGGCQHGQNEQLDYWSGPLLEPWSEEGDLVVPLYNNAAGAIGDEPFDSDLDADRQQQTWNYQSKRESQTKVWQKAFEKRLASYSKRWVRAPFLRLRVSPSLQAKVTGKLSQGDLVWVQSIKGNWARLKSGAFVPLESLSPFPPSFRGAGYLKEEALD